jgi:hypothetical protein
LGKCWRGDGEDENENQNGQFHFFSPNNFNRYFVSKQILSQNALLRSSKATTGPESGAHAVAPRAANGIAQSDAWHGRALSDIADEARANADFFMLLP